MTLTAFPPAHRPPSWGAATAWGIPQVPGAVGTAWPCPAARGARWSPVSRKPSHGSAVPQHCCSASSCSGSQCSACAARWARLGLSCGRAVPLQALRPFLSSLHSPPQQAAWERGRGEPSAPQAQEEQAQQGGEGDQRGWHPGGRGAGQQGVRAPGGTCSYGTGGAAVTFQSGFILCFLLVFFPKGRGPGSGWAVKLIAVVWVEAARAVKLFFCFLFWYETKYSSTSI